MKGTIISHQPKQGKKTFGFSLFLGRDENGKQLRQVRRGFAREKDAEEALRAAIEEHGKAPATPGNVEKSLNELFAEWMQNHVQRECTPRTAEAYQEQGAYVLRKIGGTSLQKVTRNLMEDTIHAIADHGGQVTAEHPKGRPLSRKLVRNIGFVLSGCLSYAVYRDYIPKHPMEGMKLPKLDKTRKPKLVEGDEFDEVLRLAAGTRQFPLIVLAEATGLRRGELCALRWDDIDMSTGWMLVDKSVEETKRGLRLKGTKGGRPRDFEIPAYALEVLKCWKVEQGRDRELYGAEYAGHGLIFCGPDGEYYQPSQVGARVSEVMRKAGLRRSLHCLRHSHASGLLSKGVPAATVAERLGHSNAAVTLGIYTHALKRDKDLAATVWDQERSGRLSRVIKDTRKKLHVIEKKRA